MYVIHLGFILHTLLEDVKDLSICQQLGALWQIAHHVQCLCPLAHFGCQKAVMHVQRW